MNRGGTGHRVSAPLAVQRVLFPQKDPETEPPMGTQVTMGIQRGQPASASFWPRKGFLGDGSAFLQPLDESSQVHEENATLTLSPGLSQGL